MIQFYFYKRLHISNKTQKNWVQDRSQMLLILLILKTSLSFQYSKAHKLMILHMIRFDTILQTCPVLFKYYDTIWYVSTNMSKLVHDIMVQFDKILQKCPDLFKYYNRIWQDSTNTSKHVHDDRIWYNS